jgi:hypothetical protein
MKLYFISMLLCSSFALAAALDVVPQVPKCPQKEGSKDHQLIERYKNTGQCFSYIGIGNLDKSLAPCSGPDGYCRKVKKSSSGVEDVSQY